METFDSFATRRMLVVLRERSGKDLDILARVLPLRFLPLREEDLHRIRKLPREEGEAVEKFHKDYNADHRKHVYEHIKRYNEDSDSKREFNASVQIGRGLLKETAAESGFAPEFAARGEWGLLKEIFGVKVSISLNLKRRMELSYSISLYDMSFNHIRRASFIGDLGLGWGGTWKVNSSDEFPLKFTAASKFALWHWGEYERMLRSRL